jgi:opacity protein-like surface antigen
MIDSQTISSVFKRIKKTIMKKTILIAATVATLTSSTVLADSQSSYYVKGNIGIGSLENVIDRDTSFRLKSQIHSFFGLGVGYYLLEKVRLAVIYDHYFDPELKKSGTTPQSIGNVVAFHRATIDSLMINATTNLFKVSSAQLFAGVGVGIAQIKETISKNGTGITDTSVSSGKKNNIVYGGIVGISTELNPGISSDIAYSWRDFGKTKSLKNAAGVELSKTHYRGHHFSIGFRFDI